jgi:hypothetical protein
MSLRSVFLTTLLPNRGWNRRVLDLPDRRTRLLSIALRIGLLLAECY